MLIIGLIAIGVVVATLSLGAQAQTYRCIVSGKYYVCVSGDLGVDPVLWTP